MNEISINLGINCQNQKTGLGFVTFSSHLFCGSVRADVQHHDLADAVAELLDTFFPLEEARKKSDRVTKTTFHNLMSIGSEIDL